MPRIVVEGGIVKCAHGGQAKLPSGNAKFRIGGAAVVTAGMEAGLSFLPATAPPTPSHPAPCPVKGPGTPPPDSPCSATVAATAGVSTRVKVDGAGVLLDTATGTAVNPAAPGRWTIHDPGQTRAEASA